MKLILSTIFAIAFFSSAQAKDDFIIQLDQNTSQFTFEAVNQVRLTPVAPSLGLYSVEPLNKVQLPQATFQNIKSQPGVMATMPNQTMMLRKASVRMARPNDPATNAYWNYKYENGSVGVDAFPAWEKFGTGGTDKAGNDIVIAVVDGGFDVTHPDLIGNAWVNPLETGENFNNNIDEDGNGYADDIVGWNAANNSGLIANDFHGTHVAGIMGAKGDNEIFGVGVNWNVRIMYVSAGFRLGDTRTVLTAYNYILDQKKLWLSSGGKEGANVVAINSSFGLDGFSCKRSPFTLWNQMYDELGKAGILSVVATSNFNPQVHQVAGTLDVDRVGDVPGTCESPYIITVTNSDENGRRGAAGYGKKSVDLAAPGTNILSAYPNEQFGFSTGTSMAAPHVTGAIAFMHSAASERFNKLYQSSDRSKAALDLKELLMSTVTKSSQLETQTVSGGILNLHRAAEAISKY